MLKSDPEDSAEVYKSYGRARQAIDEAEHAHGKDQVTRNLLQTVLEELIRWELSQKNVGSASYLLSELPAANLELAAAVEAQREKLADEMAELHALRDEIDPSLGSGGKVVMVAAIGLMIALIQLLSYLLGMDRAPKDLLVGYVAYLALMIAASIWLRDQLLMTQVNRSMTYTVWLLSANGLLLRLGSAGGLLGIPTVVGYDLALCSLVSAYVATLFDRRFYYSLPIYSAFTLACFVWPSLALLFFGAAHFLGLTTMALAMAYSKHAVAADEVP